MSEKVSQVNIEGRLYQFIAAQALIGRCETAANDPVKRLEMAEGAAMPDGMMLKIDFDYSNTYEPSGYSDRLMLVYGNRAFDIVDAHGVLASGSELWGDSASSTILGMCLETKFYVFGSGGGVPDFSRQGAYCDTAGNVSDKVASMKDFVLSEGVTFPITFTNGNTATAQGITLTLNINGTGVKTLAVNQATNAAFDAGTYMCYYDGTQYWMTTKYAIDSARRAGSAQDAYYLTPNDVYLPYSGLYWVIPSSGPVRLYSTVANVGKQVMVDISSTAYHVPTSKPDNTNGAIWVS